MDRRQFIVGTAGAAGSLILPGSRAFAQAASGLPEGLPDYYPADYAAIVEASKAENQLLCYSNISIDMWSGVMQRFNQLYPWIEVQTLDLESSEVMERYLAEVGTGSQTGDFMLTFAPDAWIDLHERGEIMDYRSAEHEQMPDWSIPYPGLYTCAIDPLLFVWNKALLPEDMVPTSFADFVAKAQANPEVFQDKTTTYGAQFGSFGYTANYAFIEKHGDQGWEWLQTVGPMTRVERSSGPMLEKVTTGEYVFAFFCGSGNVFLAMNDPARAQLIGWSFISDGTPMLMRGAAVPKASTNVNSAKLMLDVVLSREGQIAFSKGGRTPFRPDVTQEDIGGAYTYDAIIAEIGEESAIPVRYNPQMIEDFNAFMEKWRAAYGI